MVDIFEPNNTQATAQLIGIGSYNNLTAADDDWYKIDVEPGVVSLSMIPTNGYDANMVLYNSAGQTIAADFSDSTENILYHASFAGTLYLKVVSTSPNAVNYTLSYSKTINASGDDAFENNDSWSKATIINSSNTTLSSLKSFDDDWYKVSLNSGVVGINVSNSALFVEVTENKCSVNRAILYWRFRRQRANLPSRPQFTDRVGDHPELWPYPGCLYFCF